MDVVKSLEKYIEECVAKFTYYDFSPPINNHNLASKFENVLSKENAYWIKVESGDLWPKWIFLEFKTFANASSRLVLGLNFSDNKIICTLTKSLTDSELSDSKNKTEISICEIWLNHNKLVQVLNALVKKGIEVSNA